MLHVKTWNTEPETRNYFLFLHRQVILSLPIYRGRKVRATQGTALPKGKISERG